MNNTTPTIDELKEALKNAEKSEHNHAAKAIKAQIELMENPVEKPKSILARLFGKRAKKKK